MKCLTWILTAALLMTVLAYTVVRDRHVACQVPQLSQVLR